MSTKRPQLAAIAAAAIALSSCAGNSSLQGTPPPTSAANAAQRSHAQAKHSWIKPGAASQKLLYISDHGTEAVEIYTYPGLTYAGELTGFQQPSGVCSDQAGNVWVTDWNGGTVSEFAHGGTRPINVLSGFNYPYDCAIDRKSGDLAVSMSQDPTQLAIFHNAAGKPTYYRDDSFQSMSWLTYDNAGNVYVDGLASGDAFHYAELPAGSSTFTDIALNESIAFPGGVKWDGHDVAICNSYSTIYQVQGSTVVNSLDLNAPGGNVAGIYILASGTKMIGADQTGPDADIYAYPSGGNPVKSITGGLSQPWDVTLSL